MNITLRQLQYFLEIANQQSVTAAAKKLNMSQPPLSAQLKLLENELGTKLFYRKKHRMVITEAGEKLRDRADQILSLVDDTSKTIKNLDDINSGTIRIGAITSACLQILPEKAKQFLKHYPKVDFVIQETSAHRIGELVKNGVMDIGIVREPFNTNQFNFSKINNPDPNFVNDELIAVGARLFFEDPNSDTIEFSQLSNLPLIIFKTYEEVFNDISSKTDIEFSVVCRNDNPVSAIGWAINELGISILPRSSLAFVRALRYDLAVKTIINPHIPANIIIITDTDANHPPFIKHFINLF